MNDAEIYHRVMPVYGILKESSMAKRYIKLQMVPFVQEEVNDTVT